MAYYPKRPIRSFQDLQVYQLTYNLAVKIVKKLPKNQKLSQTTLSIPRLIATAHSIRFGDSQKAIQTLEKTMLKCNLAVFYLELARDLSKTKIKTSFFETTIKNYLQVRTKILRLQKSWVKFSQNYNLKYKGGK